MTGSNKLKETTVAVYDKFAKEYAEKFAGIGARTGDIEQTIALFGKENPRVLEIGCGDGRDAVEIAKLTNNYRGIDISQGMIELAKQNHPDLDFQAADLENYKFPDNLDIIFAFASLLHSDKESFKEVLQKAHQALSAGGLVYISLKEGEYTGPVMVKDDYGDRVFYYYSEEDLPELTVGYEVVFVRHAVVGKTKWLDVILRKK